MSKTPRTKIAPSNFSEKLFTTKKVNEIMAVVFPRGKKHPSMVKPKALVGELNYIAHGALEASEFGRLRQRLDQAEKPVNNLKKQMDQLLVEIRGLTKFEKAPRVFEQKINISLNENPRLQEKMAIRFPCIVPTKEANPFAGDDEDSLCFDFSPLKMLNDLQDKIEIISECLGHQSLLPKCPDDGTRRERKNDKLFDFIVRDLCFVWTNTLGQEIGTSTIRSNSKKAGGNAKSGNSKAESSGPLVRFIAEFCRQLSISKTNPAIQEAIKKFRENNRGYDAHRSKRIEQSFLVYKMLNHLTGHGE